MLRIPHCLDNRLTDGGKAVSRTPRLLSTPRKHNFSASGTHFCQRLGIRTLHTERPGCAESSPSLRLPSQGRPAVSQPACHCSKKLLGAGCEWSKRARARARGLTTVVHSFGRRQEVTFLRSTTHTAIPPGAPMRHHCAPHVRRPPY
jgi:hypothetical protein